MVMLEVSLAEDGSIEFPSERAPFSVSVRMRVHSPRTAAIK